MRSKHIALKVLRLTFLLVVVFGLAVGTAVAQPGIEPPVVDELIFPGESVAVDKTVWTPEIPPNPVVVFLADTTGSMGPAIANVKTNATDVMNAVLAVQSTAKFAVAQYRDVGDTPVFNVDQDTTGDTGLVLAAINGWSAGGGGDTPEAQLHALWQIATGAVTIPAPPEDMTPIIAWFGDASGHDPSIGINEATATAALVAAGYKVVAVPVATAAGDGLDSTGQATRITDATGGALVAADPDEVADAILEGLQNLPVDVAMDSNCSPPISTTFVPLEVLGVISGESVSFVETIMVASGTPVGVYVCQDWALIDGQPMVDGDGNIIYEEKTIHVPGITLEPPLDSNELPEDTEHTVVATVSAPGWGPVPGVRVEIEILPGSLNEGWPIFVGTTDANGQVVFTYLNISAACEGLGTDQIVARFTDGAGSVVYGHSEIVRKDWIDTTPPEAECVECENPHGEKKPKAPGQGGQGQNQDGFYELRATDDVDPDPEIFVYDMGSGTVFGPFIDGTKIKYTEDADAVPEQKEIGSNKGKAAAIDWHIIGNGDAAIFAVDCAGNVSDRVLCLVPPPPM